MAFKSEFSFQSIEHGLEPLPDAAEGPDSGLLVFAVGPDHVRADAVDERFEVVDGEEGLMLRREAHAINANVFVAAGVSAGTVKVPWAVQAASLRQAVLKHSKGRG